VRACRQNKFPVTVIPGPSSVTAALALSGFSGGGFICEGFLPRKAGERTRRLNQLDKAGLPVIIFESPYRCLRLLEELNKMFPEREIFIGRELTKLNEECLWGTAAELIAVFAGRGVKNPGQRIKGEITVVISPAAKKEKKDQEAMGHPGSV
jgi:16S rRNA (cytidine1402-2'-O)-methyltransferase